MSMGRGYFISNRETGYTVAKDLLGLSVAATTCVAITKIEVMQDTQTSSESLTVVTILDPTGDPTGNAITPTLTEQGLAASDVTANDCQTADGTGGTQIHAFGWNVLSPLVWHPTPEEYYVLSPSGFFTVRLNEAPGASMDITCHVSWLEVGG